MNRPEPESEPAWLQDIHARCRRHQFKDANNPKLLMKRNAENARLAASKPYQAAGREQKPAAAIPHDGFRGIEDTAPESVRSILRRVK